MKDFTDQKPFLLHMGDDLVLSREGNSHLKRLIRVFKERKADVAFLATRVKDPTMYGVIVGKQIAKGLHEVETIVYRPKVPPSNLSDVTAYILKPNIYPEIKKVEPNNESGEVSLIPAIQSIINGGGRVYAVELQREEKRIDIGNPKLYWQALNATYKLFGGEGSS